MGISCYLSVGPGSGRTTTVAINATIGVNTTPSPTDILVAEVIITDTQTEGAAYSSTRLDAGDYFTVNVSFPGVDEDLNLSENLTVYVHLF